MNNLTGRGPSRRLMLKAAMLGIGHVALIDMLCRAAGAGGRLLGGEPRPKGPGNPLAPKSPLFAGRAKRMIYIFLDGGISHIDTWDYKPLLQRDDGKELPASIRPPKFTFAPQGRLLGSPWKFAQRGQSGLWMSELFPHLNELADDLCFIRSMHHDNNDHNTAKSMIHTGHGREPRPTMGAWLAYGLGADASGLPAYVDIMPPQGQSMPSAFLPARYAGVPIIKASPSDKQPTWENLRGRWNGQRRNLDLIQAMNRRQMERSGVEDALEAEISSMELAFRMQAQGPAAMDVDGESQAVKELYGIGQGRTDSFGRACLLGRRLAERGVRYITITHSTRKYGNLWDQHDNLKTGHEGNASEVDRPIAGLLKDLKARGMLEDTLVMCGSEFGRTPSFEFYTGAAGTLRNGRDHNPHGFTLWLAGAGVKGGMAHGATDDYGYYAVKDKVSVHDLHATLLHLMGIDHEKLTWRHEGRDHRLTDVYGNVVREILG